ncbi:hypothetical protein WAK64_17650 [Bacillus spongiae]|uniref:DUF4359 domain-containing protein n=1 Tax=Bacillus spongiae TaxID=2683610 RepID=A0ABU8HIA0_9BACI
MSQIKRILLFVLLVSITIFMIMTQPNEADFYSWLEDQHDIHCESFTCSQTSESSRSVTYIETGSYIEKGYLIFHTIDKTYEKDDGTSFTVKVLGIFGAYIPLIDEIR